MNALELNTRLDDVVSILMEVKGESESIAEEAIDCLITQFNKGVKTILSVRISNTTYLCLKDGAYTDYYAVFNEEVNTTHLFVLCSIASKKYFIPK